MKTFAHKNTLKWNYEALALQIKIKSNKKRRPLTYSLCLKLCVCKNCVYVRSVCKPGMGDLNGRILLRFAVRTRQWTL